MTKTAENTPEIHMENVNLSEDFDDVSEDYWQDTSLFVVRTAMKGEDGERDGTRTTSFLAMMMDKDSSLNEDNFAEEENIIDSDIILDNEELSSGLLSCLENSSESDYNISSIRSSLGPRSQDYQESESKKTVKAAAEKLNEVTRQMFSSSTISSLNLQELSEQFYHAYREFVFSIEEGANTKADIPSLGCIIEKLKSITEASSRLLLVVNAATVNPSGKEKISSAARTVIDCIDQVIAVCSWETNNSDTEDKSRADTGISDSSSSTGETGKELDEEDSKTDIILNPKVCVKINHEMMQDVRNLDEKYRVLTENTIFTERALIKDKIIINDQKITTSDTIIIKQDMISEYDAVAHRPPVSPRKHIKSSRQLKQKEAKSSRFVGEEVDFLENNMENKDSPKTKSTHKIELKEREENEQEIILDKELIENNSVSKELINMPSKGKSTKNSNNFVAQENINLSILGEDKEISTNKVIATEKSRTTDDPSLRAQETAENKKYYLNNVENIRPNKIREDRGFSASQKSTADIGVSTDSQILMDKVAAKKRSMSTDRKIQVPKNVMTDDIITLQKGVLTSSGVLSQKGIMTDKVFVKDKEMNTKQGPSAHMQISVTEELDLISKETPEQSAVPIRRSLSESMLVADDGVKRELAIIKHKSCSTEKILSDEHGIMTDSAIKADKQLSTEKIFHEERGIGTDSKSLLNNSILLDNIIPEWQKSAKPNELLDQEIPTEKTMAEKEMLTDEKQMGNKLMTEKVVTEEMGINSDLTGISENGKYKEKGTATEPILGDDLSVVAYKYSSSEVGVSTKNVFQADKEVDTNTTGEIPKAVKTINTTHTQTELIIDSNICQEDKNVCEKGVETQLQFPQNFYVEDRRVATDPNATIERGVAADVVFTEQKPSIEERANMSVAEPKSETLEYGTVTDLNEDTRNCITTGRSMLTYSDNEIFKYPTSDIGITTDPWPEIQKYQTEERSVSTEIEMTGQRQTINDVSVLTEKHLTADMSVLTEKCVISEKSISTENDLEMSKYDDKNNWRASDTDTSTDVSTFQSLSEHYSKASDESLDVEGELINLTDEESGPNFELTICHHHPEPTTCHLHHKPTTPKLINLIDLLPDDSMDSVDEETNFNDFPLTQLLNQLTKKGKNTCFNYFPTIKGGDDDRQEPLQLSDSHLQLNNENEKLIGVFQQPYIDSKVDKTKSSLREEILPQDISEDSSDDNGETQTTSNDYALCRTLAELKWAQTSIKRLESEKKMLHSQLDEVMQTGFQKGKEQLQQLVQAESMLQNFRQQHERDFQLMAQKREELVKTINQLQSEKSKLLEKLTQTKKCCEMVQNKIKKNADAIKNTELSFKIEKKQLKKEIDKLNEDLMMGNLEKEKLKEALKTVKAEFGKLNKEFEKAKATQRKQAEQLQEAKDSSNRLLQRTNSDLFSMQKIQKTLHDNIQRLEKEKSVLEFELKCETNKVTILQKDIDALWKECNQRRSSLDENQERRQTFPQERPLPKQEALLTQTQTSSQNRSKSLLTMLPQQWEISTNRLTNVPQSVSQVNMSQMSQGKVLLQQPTAHPLQEPASTMFSLINGIESSSQQSPQIPTLIPAHSQRQTQYKLPSKPIIHAGAVVYPKAPNSNKLQSVLSEQSQNLPTSDIQKDTQCMKNVMVDQKLIKSKVQHEQERNRRLQRKILHLKTSEQKKKQFLISKLERERKRTRSVMEKHKQILKQTTQRLKSADIMLDIEREKNNVMQHEIATIKAEKEKQAEVSLNANQDFEQINTHLTQVEIGQNIDKVNYYLEQQQLEYQLRMAARENEIVMEKNKLQEDLFQLRLNYEKILSMKEVEPNEIFTPPLHSPALYPPYNTSKLVFTPTPTWKKNFSKDLTY